MRKLVLALFCLLCIAPVCMAQDDTTEVAPPPKGSISGLVIRGDTGTPLPDAEITIAQQQYPWNKLQTRFTAADGRFLFEGLAPDVYVVSAVHRRFISPLNPRTSP